MSQEPEGPAWLRGLIDRKAEVIPLLPAGTQLAGRDLTGPSDPPRRGILVIDKPAGSTSFAVVRAVKTASGERRVGHAGTLDPAASGVLVVCLGSATRLVELIQELPKTYVGDVTFGTATDSYDADGAVTDTGDPGRLSRSDLETALEAFRGPILQVPPMVSALRHEGRRLYELSREGIEIPREARSVTVYSLELSEWRPPVATLQMTVSRGTYVRSIAHDLGQAVGCPAHLSRLVRETTGPFSHQDAITVEAMAEAFAEGWWTRILRPADSALEHLAALVVDADGETALRQGRQIEGPRPTAATAQGSSPVLEPVRAYGAAGSFIGLVVWDSVTERWQPEIILPPTDSTG